MTRGARCAVIALDPAGGDRADARGREDVPAREHLVARAHVTTTAPDVGSCVTTAAAISISVGRTTTRSTGITASAPSGTTAPVEISIASPAPRLLAAGRPGGGMTDDRQHAGSVAGPDRVAVHRRARERRQVDRATRPRAARILPAARESGTSSAGRARACARTAASASATGNSELTIARYTRLEAGTLAGVISVVIPVHDEERSVALLYDELSAAFDGDGRSWEAVFVDDGSTDGTFGALTRLHDAHDNVRVVRLRRNFGKATALDAGFAEAAGDIVVTIDGDLQDDPAEIPRLLAKLDEGYDLVSGLEDEAARPDHPPHPVEDLQHRRRQGLRRAAPRHELRAQGVPRRGRRRHAALRRAPSLHPRPRPLPRLPRHGAARQPPARGSTVARTTASSGTCAASSTCSR